MIKSNRLGTALTAVSLIAVAAGCAGPGNRIRTASMFGGKVNSGELPLNRARSASFVISISGR